MVDTIHRQALPLDLSQQLLRCRDMQGLQSQKALQALVEHLLRGLLQGHVFLLPLHLLEYRKMGLALAVLLLMLPEQLAGRPGRPTRRAVPCFSI